MLRDERIAVCRFAFFGAAFERSGRVGKNGNWVVPTILTQVDSSNSEAQLSPLTTSHPSSSDINPTIAAETKVSGRVV